MLRASLVNLPRPVKCFPLVFTSMDDPRFDEIIGAQI